MQKREIDYAVDLLINVRQFRVRENQTQNVKSDSITREAFNVRVGS